jgi:subtilisin-like proprotein convertase family protein
LIDVGLVTNTLSLNLTNKAALIQHGTNFDYALEIARVAQAGAAFAILFHNTDTEVPSAVVDTDFVPIPAVIIGLSKGTAIRNYLQTNATGMAQIQLLAANYSFAFSQTLSCEHVGVRVSLNHPSRADLRITLVSPAGTRSVLQRVNGDTNAAPTDWTYWSTHHFYESSAGTWTVSVSDEFPVFTGSVQSVELKINGVAITDSDHDGLDDNWEMSRFGSLVFGPKDDPDKDGYNNAHEQVMGTNPNAVDNSFQIDFSRWNPTLARLSWPSSTNFNYEVWSGTNVANLSAVTNISGRFPETEWFTAYPNPASASRFFSVRALPKP